jgi:N-acetylneuraminic acid mutarotase
MRPGRHKAMKIFRRTFATRLGLSFVAKSLACILAILCLLTIPTLTAARSESPKPWSLEWSKSTPFPEPRAGYASGVFDGKLVIAGGTYWEGTPGHWVKKRFSASTHAFDPQSQHWEKLPDLPVPLAYAASAVVNNSLFVLGGYTGAAVNQRIFTLQKIRGRYVWKDFGEMKIDRVFASAVSHGTDIYLVGGATAFEAVDDAGTCCTTRTATDSLLVFHTGHPEKGWQQLAADPGGPHWMPAVAGDSDSIWVLGGSYRAEAGTSATISGEVRKYNIREKKWDVLSPLPKEIKELQPLTALSVSGSLIIVSGYKSVWRLRENDMTYISASPMPEAVDVGQFVWLSGAIVGAGGESQTENPRRRSPWTFVAKVVPLPSGR